MKLLLLLILSLGLSPVWSQELSLQAPNSTFPYVDQKNGIGNSCGPTALLNAFGSGDKNWHSCYQKIPGTSDRARIASVIKSWGQKPSETLPNKNRWQIKGGVNFSDLAVMAEEMRKLHWNLPKIKSELFFTPPGNESKRQLNSAHKRLRKSLKKGFPPILSIRRFAYRDGQWQSVHGHFVVLTALPDKIARDSRSFPVEFVDSTDAKRYRGVMTAADESSPLPCLVLDCSASAIGKNYIRSDEKHTLGFAGAIGAW